MTRRILCTLIFLGFALEGYGQNLRDSTNQADYLVVAPLSYYPVAEKLSAFRHSKNGFSTMVVNIDSIIAQFGSSVSPDTALRNFIQHALISWRDPHPQYIVLAGNTNVIPSHIEVESIFEQGNHDTLIARDQWFVQIPGINTTYRTDACLGRFPAWDSASLATMVEKTIQYENDVMHPWYNKAIALADYRPQDGSLFEDDSKQLQSYLDTLWTDTVCVHIRTDSPNYIDSTAFVNLWNEGFGVLLYTGHANDYQLSYSRYFTTWTVDSLTNGDRQPVCFFGGCDLNFDTEPTHSISTHLLERKGGGAVAAIASDGLMYEFTALTFYKSLFDALIRNPDVSLAKAYEQAIPGWAFDYSDRFTFLGDPALTVKHSVRSTGAVTIALQPTSYQLEQNFPNPFNPATIIRYTIPINTLVTLKVYDILGRDVRTLANERQGAGDHSVVFNAGGLPSGVYFYTLHTGNFTQTKKLLLLK